MRQFLRKRIETKEEEVADDGCLHGGIVGRLRYSDFTKKVESEAPTVIVESAEKGDVEIYGEYVGRIRAQQFVEVRARVEGYLENMLFAEGTYVTKNQVLL